MIVRGGELAWDRVIRLCVTSHEQLRLRSAGGPHDGLGQASLLFKAVFCLDTVPRVLDYVLH